MFSKTLSSDSKSMSKTSTNPAKCICNLYGGRREGGGLLTIRLKTAHCKVQLTMSFAHEATKNPIFQGFLNQQFQTKKTIDSCF